MTIALELDEGDRQLVLLALAVLSLRSPGFDYALNRIALRIDKREESDDRAALYDALRNCRRDIDGSGRAIECDWCHHEVGTSGNPGP